MKGNVGTICSSPNTATTPVRDIESDAYCAILEAFSTSSFSSVRTKDIMQKPVKPKQRRTQERTEITQNKLQTAALQLFTERGYEGVTIRDIEIKADVQRGLLNYHFGDKKGVWKLMADNLFTLLDEHMEVRTEFLQELPAKDRVAYVIRTYVRFSANHPELNRLMVQEGKKDNWRMHYIADTYTRPAMNRLKGLVQQGLNISDEQFVHWYYLFVSASGLFFSVSPEVQTMFAIDSHASSNVEEHAQFIIDCLITNYESKR